MLLFFHLYFTNSINLNYVDVVQNSESSNFW